MAKKIKIVAIGKVKERPIAELIAEFSKRLGPLCDVQMVELKDEGPKKEADKLKNYLNSSTYILDETGKQLTSLEFAALIKRSEQELTFIIGGPDGLDDSIKKKGQLFSLGKMTLTHEMARLILLEQIYRAAMINSGRTYYHK